MEIILCIYMKYASSFFQPIINICVKDFYASIIIVNNKELFDLIVLVLGGGCDNDIYYDDDNDCNGDDDGYLVIMWMVLKTIQWNVKDEILVFPGLNSAWVKVTLV